MRVVDVLDGETKLSTLLAAVEGGEEIVIARAGVPVARLIPLNDASPRLIGIDDGHIWIADDFDRYIPEGFDV